MSKTAPACLESTVARINRVILESGWARTHRIAAILTEDLPEARFGTLASFQQLASRPDCPFRKTQLRDIVAAEKVYQDQEVVRRSRFLTPSHAATVAALSRSAQTSLLLAAEERMLTVREFRAVVQDFRKQEGEPRGRPPAAPARRALTRFDNALLAIEEGLELCHVHPEDRDTRERLAKLLREIRERSEEGLRRFEPQLNLGPTIAKRNVEFRSVKDSHRGVGAIKAPVAVICDSAAG